MFNIQLQKNKNLEGKEVEVLVENKLKNQTNYFGRTKQMTPVIFQSISCSPGDLIKVKINFSNLYNLFGKQVESKIRAA